MREIRLQTERKTQLVDITAKVQEALGDTNGAAAALVYVPHTTAGVTINEQSPGTSRPRSRTSSTTAGSGSTWKIRTGRTLRRTSARR
jgi:thiamine phosphate synthase YjbQ (UPF0047 family)